HRREDRHIAPAERRAVEPVAAVELALEPAIHRRNLLAGAGDERVRERTGRAFEDADLVKRPVDRLVVRVADLLDHSDARALRRPSRRGPICVAILRCSVAPLLGVALLRLRCSLPSRLVSLAT